MNRSFSLLLLPLSLLFFSGCAADDYYCDATGCYLCDGLSCRLVDPPGRAQCRGDFECGMDTRCTDLGCTLTCEVDSECARGTVCRDGYCVGVDEPDPVPNPGSCEVTADCMASGLTCVNGVCAVDENACLETADCAGSNVCVEGQCRDEVDACRFNFECVDGKVCLDARCVDSCSTVADCGAGESCEGGVCTVAQTTPQCVLNSECTAGVCVDGRCTSQCTDDSGCPAGDYCQSGVCADDNRAHTFCSSDDECMPGHPCRDGVCRTPCADDDECLLFDIQFSICLDGYCATQNEFTSDCATSEDCDQGERCLDGVCS